MSFNFPNLGRVTAKLMGVHPAEYPGYFFLSNGFAPAFFLTFHFSLDWDTKGQSSYKYISRTNELLMEVSLDTRVFEA